MSRAPLIALLLGLLAGLALAAGAAHGKEKVQDALAARCGLALRGALAEGPWGAEDSLEFSWELPPLSGVPANAEIQAEALQLRERGTCALGLRLLEQGRVLRRLTVPVRVRRWERLPVARRDLLRGRVLAVEDLEERWLETTHLSGGDLPRLPEVLGRRLARYLPAGRAIPGRLLETPPDVRRGEPLTLTVHSGGVSISAAAEALEDGCIGRSLRVRMTDTGRRLNARLTTRDRAEVEVSG